MVFEFITESYNYKILLSILNTTLLENYSITCDYLYILLKASSDDIISRSSSGRISIKLYEYNGDGDGNGLLQIIFKYFSSLMTEHSSSSNKLPGHDVVNEIRIAEIILNPTNSMKLELLKHYTLSQFYNFELDNTNNILIILEEAPVPKHEANSFALKGPNNMESSLIYLENYKYLEFIIHKHLEGQSIILSENLDDNCEEAIRLKLMICAEVNFDDICCECGGEGHTLTKSDIGKVTKIDID